MKKLVGIAWAKARPGPSRYDDDRLMTTLAAHIHKRHRGRSIGRGFSQRDSHIALQASKAPAYAGRIRETAVKQRQTINPAIANENGRNQGIDPTERKHFADRRQTSLVHLADKPIT